MAGYTYKFYLNTNKSKGDKVPLYLRITVNRKKAELATGIWLLHKDWNPSRQRSHKNMAVNSAINDIENRILDISSSFTRDDRKLSAKAIKDGLSQIGNNERGVLEYFEDYIHKIQKANQIEKSSINSYVLAMRYLKDYVHIRYHKEDLWLEQINYEFIDGFDLYLIEKGLQRNTITKHEKKLKAVLSKAVREGHMLGNPYSDFKLKGTVANRQFLTQDEIDIISNHPLAGNESLIKVRDIFIFSVYTGLRFKDAMNLRMEQIIDDGSNVKMIHFNQHKTKKTLSVPILAEAMAIIEKYENKERMITGKVLPQLSNQKTNAYLKTIADLCGIKKELTHHVARHTCATTVLLTNDIPIEAVSRWLGHTNIKTTQIYAKITPAYLKLLAEKIQNKKT